MLLPFVRTTIAVLTLCAPFMPSAASAATPAAAVLMAQLESADPSLESYRANIEFSVGLKTFPFLHKTVHGDTFFKRPARMEVVFSDLPPFAQAFKNLYIGLGTPADWEKKFSIDAAQTAGPSGVGYLVLTPRVADHRLRSVFVYVDPATSLPNRIVWNYRDGRIVMEQNFVAVGGHTVVARQVADIRLPGVHAYVDAKMANYAFNIPIDDAVFTKRPAQAY